MATTIKCPEGHTTVWKKGKTPTRRGLKVRYMCSTCGRTFYAPTVEAKKSSKRKKG